MNPNQVRLAAWEIANAESSPVAPPKQKTRYWMPVLIAYLAVLIPFLGVLVVCIPMAIVDSARREERAAAATAAKVVFGSKPRMEGDYVVTEQLPDGAITMKHFAYDITIAQGTHDGRRYFSLQAPRADLGYNKTHSNEGDGLRRTFLKALASHGNKIGGVGFGDALASREWMYWNCSVGKCTPYVRDGVWAVPSLADKGSERLHYFRVHIIVKE